MKTLLFLSSFLILASCTPTKTVEPSASGGKINLNAPYSWSMTAFPKNLVISESFNPNEVSAIKEMANKWEDSTGNQVDFFNTTEGAKEISSPTLNLDSLGSDGVNGIYKLTSWPSELSGNALAVTQIFASRYNRGKPNEFAVIEHADILINEAYYDFRTHDNVTSWTFDFKTVVLHELGHFLGLGHKTGDTVMITAIGYDTVVRNPSSTDISDIASKYNFSVGGTGHSTMAMPVKPLASSDHGPGESIRILIELMANGECVHKENGVIVERHFN